jgi:hypothetical protein
MDIKKNRKSYVGLHNNLFILISFFIIMGFDSRSWLSPLANRDLGSNSSILNNKKRRGV